MMTETTPDIPLNPLDSDTELSTRQATDHPAPPALAMLRTLVITALLSGFLVVLVVQWASPRIEQNQKAATEAAVFNVIKGATTSRTFRISEQGVQSDDTPNASGFILYAGYDDSGRLLGLAIPGVATGYAGPVYILFGYQPQQQVINAYQVLTMTETPGLGDKVLTDPDFLANFKALDARLNDDGKALANAIVTVKNGTKSHPWEVDAISGATITSTAIGKAINDSARQWLPLVQRYLDQFQLSDRSNEKEHSGGQS